MPDNVSFSERLASLLAERGLTQMELADRIGVTRAAMSRYVSGDREPRFVTIVRIAEELQVPIDQLAFTEAEVIDASVRLVARSRLTDEQVAALNKSISRGKAR